MKRQESVKTSTAAVDADALREGHRGTRNKRRLRANVVEDRPLDRSTRGVARRESPLPVRAIVGADSGCLADGDPFVGVVVLVGSGVAMVLILTWYFLDSDDDSRPPP